LSVVFDGSLFADYHQFYLADEIAKLPEMDYTAEDLRARIVTSEHGLVVFTVRNMNVQVRVELHGEEPRIDREEANHVVMGISARRTDRYCWIVRLGSGGGAGERSAGRSPRYGHFHRPRYA